MREIKMYRARDLLFIINKDLSSEKNCFETKSNGQPKILRSWKQVYRMTVCLSHKDDLACQTL